jgi:hypothetical protein
MRPTICGRRGFCASSNASATARVPAYIFSAAQPVERGFKLNNAPVTAVRAAVEQWLRQDTSEAVSRVVIGAIQVVLDGGHAFSIAGQVLPSALLTLGEVLVSATGRKFADSQAPQAMKGLRMSFWPRSVTMGNLWVTIGNRAVPVVNAGVKHNAVTGSIGSTGLGVTAFQNFFFAGFAFLSALVFGRCARSCRGVDHHRKAEGARRSRAPRGAGVVDPG